MTSLEDIRTIIAANTPTCLGGFFEISSASDGALRVSRARDKGHFSCSLDLSEHTENTMLSLRPLDGAPEPEAAAALLSSGLIAAALPTGPLDPDSLADLPWPPISPLFEMQLAVLWRRFEAAPHERPALVGAFDRIAAELYQLTIDDLITFERNRTPHS